MGLSWKREPKGRLSEQTKGLRASGQRRPDTDMRCVVTTETTATSFMCSGFTVAQENSSSKSQQRQSHHRFSNTQLRFVEHSASSQCYRNLLKKTVLAINKIFFKIPTVFSFKKLYQTYRLLVLVNFFSKSL